MSIKKKIKNIDSIVYINDKIKEFYYKYLISDKNLLNKQFKEKLGRKINFKSPIKYNDKLQWLKLYWYDPLATKCADKYEVRNYVANTIGSKYLNNLIAVYESVEDINLDKLPRSFVLKGTHGSGFNIICKDKYHMDWKSQFKKMKRWLWTNYYWSKREWVYKEIKPRIICEEYLEDESGNPPMDYKIFCFHGEPKLIQVDIDRFGSHKSNFYNPEWIFMDIEIENDSDKSITLNRPDNLDEMLNLSRRLAEPFPYVRVDFYNYNEKIIFGELTFFHHSGMGRFRPKEFEIEMGNYIKLPDKD